MFIIHGKVEIEMTDKDENPVVIETLRHGDIICPNNILFNKEVLFNAHVVERASVMKISK